MAVMIEISRMFKKHFDQRDKKQQQIDLQKIRLLADNPAHPSLNAHQLEGVAGIWECYLNRGDRLLYEIIGDVLRLWEIGGHEIVDRIHIHKARFSDKQEFLTFPVSGNVDSSAEPNYLEAPQEEKIEADSVTEFHQSQSPNMYVTIPRSWLRILGVPADLVKAVQGATSLEEIEAVDSLPIPVRSRLIELATHPLIAMDTSQLIYRTTLDSLSDYAEGKLKRLMLNLSAEQQRFVDYELDGPALLRGCAGSGKTSILIYRAVRLAMEGKNVLLVTYSRALTQALISYIEELIGELPKNLSVVNLNAWIASYLTQCNRTITIGETKQLDGLLRKTLAEVSQTGIDTSRVPFAFLKDEIAQVIKSNGLSSLKEYESWERYGRGRSLSPSQRRGVWAIYTRYQETLKNSGLADWADQTLVAMRILESNPLETPYDCVLVDEAQDLTGAQFRLLQMIVQHDKTGPSLFFVGDESQTLYTRGFTWQQVGLQLRGHSFHIRKNFRGTRPIAKAAATLLKHNKLFTLATEMVDPNVSDRDGPPPLIIHYKDRDHARKLVCDLILALVSDGTFRLSDFVILCPTNKFLDDYMGKLGVMEIPATEVKGDAKVDMLDETVKILTLHSAKGLEFPVVFIVGLEQEELPRSIPSSDVEEQTFELEKQRILLYVGLTRASEALYLVTPERPSLQSQFIAELGESVQEMDC